VLHPRVALVGAVHEIAIAAVDTVSAAAAEEADADALVRLPALDAFSDCVDPADRFVAGHPRPLDRQYPLDRRGIGMAHAAGFDADADMTGRRIEQWLFGQLQLAWTDRLHRAIGRSTLNNLPPSLSLLPTSTAGFRLMTYAIAPRRQAARSCIRSAVLACPTPPT
jgi:hypothetical protein